MSNELRRNGIIDDGKHKKFQEKKWIYREYNMQKTTDVEHQDVQMYCTTNQFPTLSFCGSHKKTHGERILGKHYNMRFFTKIRHGTCVIRCIPCACTQCTPMIYETCYTGVPLHQ